MQKYKIVGNMLWNTVAAVPPRQVTPVEREMAAEIEFWHRQFDAFEHILRAKEQNLALDLAAQKAMEAVEELARVRGLLQRGYHLVNVAGSCADEPEEVGDKWMEEVESELKTGAESADIRKPPQTAAGDFELDFLQTCNIKDRVIREGDENTQIMLSELLSAYKFLLSREKK